MILDKRMLDVHMIRHHICTYGWRYLRMTTSCRFLTDGVVLYAHVSSPCVWTGRGEERPPVPSPPDHVSDQRLRRLRRLRGALPAGSTVILKFGTPDWTPDTSSLESDPDP